MALRLPTGNNGNGGNGKGPGRKGGSTHSTKPKTLLDYIGVDHFDSVQLVSRLVQLGLTNNEIGQALGISKDAFYWMLRKNPELAEVVVAARERPNAAVQAALFKRAVGFKTREIVLANGRPTKVILNEFPPDVTACIFWLKNKDSENWKDVTHVNLTLRDQIARATANPAVQALPDPNVVDAEEVS